MARTDRLSEEQRRKTMRAVKSKDSKIELKLRTALWKRGYRYRKNYSHLRGKPDIVFVSTKIAVFCDSEFWHGYDWENAKYEIKSNREFWWPKIERNIERDKEINEELEGNGWLVLRFWGKEITNNLEACIMQITNAIETRNRVRFHAP